jgi:hypothetical protein
MIEVLVGSEVRNIGSIIEHEFEPAQDLIESLLRDTWKQKALETKSYLTGAYYGNIHVEGDSIVSDIGYGDIIETIGWPTQGPRFPAQLAIDAAGPDIEKILGDAAERVIDLFQ